MEKQKWKRNTNSSSASESTDKSRSSSPYEYIFTLTHPRNLYTHDTLTIHPIKSNPNILTIDPLPKYYA